MHVPVEKASVVLVTDESGSMQADDVSPTRLQAAQGAARSFLSDAPKSLLIGFAGFSSSVETNVAPTTDRAAVTSAIDALSAEGGTATGDALSAALDQLAARKGTDGRTAPAAIVLLSDGARTAGSDPLAAAARAKRLGIPIYTVALGTQSGTLSLPDGQTLERPAGPADARADRVDVGRQDVRGRRRRHAVGDLPDARVEARHEGGAARGHDRVRRRRVVVAVGRARDERQTRGRLAL